MSRVEVVVASMHQQCKALCEKMNIQCDVMIANQADHYGYEEISFRGHRARMLTTATRGVGLNRNLGLQLAEGEILMLADEDIEYHDGYAEMIEDAFLKMPYADVIIFRMQFIKDGKIFETDTFGNERCHLWNGLSFGTYQIAIRKSAVLRENLSFTELFGGGCIYSAGEDSKFLSDCYYRGLKVYTCDRLIGDNIRDTSSWFEGYTKKFFYDKGAIAACAFSKWLQIPVIFHYLYSFRKDGEMKAGEKLRLMLMGKKGYKTLQPYNGEVFH